MDIKIDAPAIKSWVESVTPHTLTVDYPASALAINQVTLSARLQNFAGQVRDAAAVLIIEDEVLTTEDVQAQYTAVADLLDALSMAVANDRVGRKHPELVAGEQAWKAQKAARKAAREARS
jgi:hypothetical protein